MNRIAVVLMLAGIAAAQDEKPQCKDKTGMAWTHPFSEAVALAKKSGRLLLIKPIAFGTSKDGGW